MKLDKSYAKMVEKWQHRPAWIAEAHDILTRAAVRPGDLILDVGTNTGRMMQYAQEVFHALPVGVEVNEDAVRIAKETLPFPALIFPTVTAATQATAGGYDAVILSHVLGHVPDPDQMLMESLQACRPLGCVVVVGPNPVYDNLMAPMNAFTGYRSDPTLIHSITAKQMLKVVSDFGKAHAEIFYIGEGPAWLFGMPCPAPAKSRLGMIAWRDYE